MLTYELCYITKAIRKTSGAESNQQFTPIVIVIGHCLRGFVLSLGFCARLSLLCHFALHLSPLLPLPIHSLFCVQILDLLSREFSAAKYVRLFLFRFIQFAQLYKLSALLCLREICCSGNQNKNHTNK